MRDGARAGGDQARARIGDQSKQLVDRATSILAAIEEANAHPGPVLVDFRVEAEGNVWPMVPAGAALSETVEAPASPSEVTR